MELNDRIKMIRSALGITQSKFAKRIAVVTSFVSEVENGLREPNERALRLIIAEYNVNEQWLRTGNGNMFNEDMSAVIAEAGNIVKGLTGPFQEGALKILYAIKDLHERVYDPKP